MPKPMTMQIEVEEVAFGKVWRTLDTMPGVVSITLNGSGPKPAKLNGKSNGKSNGHAAIGYAGNGKKIQELVLEAIADGKLWDRPSLIPFVEAAGKKASSLPDTLYKLKRAKMLVSPELGRYKITALGKRAVEEGNQEGT